ncbi:hypothetical protein PABG_01438 [Paracoccidioides brasiliensis Pb03]|uniref:ER membrane protein complex subunit 6 n=2 Tax=Paracoccidioides TaxID=38946 RepID=C1GQJ7_PARBA|nr:hypothetical protein PAAG_00792 [Paracoccidioides lutzii Pb01]EEH19119.1 hypothetical protein PABG_01438 [Paracoccidioides brasiliensis Pb03]EEH37871.1 hypothetical protein PAAG_00792 [Paracoccidioides lutzii Pb01]ODH21703.1 hypothetical protein ACO22_05626 [Paracoccidioides brasiliensis]ODH50922.1 hypothetical protein GX48_02882 [Paracoccidioides brasiliensis]
MPPTSQELSLLINPLVPDSVMHNNRTLSNLHSLTAFLLGISAGILGLRSSQGFLFYLLGSLIVSFLFHAVLIGFGNGMGVGAYFPGTGELITEGQGDGSSKLNKQGSQTRKGAWRDVWFGGGSMGEALSGFVLGWAGVGGVLR